MSTRIKIDPFDPRRIQPGSTVMVIGQRKTGKSVVLSTILEAIYQDYDTAMAFCGSSNARKNIERHVPGMFIFEKDDGEYDFDKAERMVSLAMKHDKESEHPRRILSINDDVAHDEKVLKCKPQKKIHLNGRHWDLTQIFLTQYCMLIPILIRNNLDFVIVTREIIRENLKRLYAHFFGIFSGQKQFEKVFKRCTEQYSCMVIDKTEAEVKFFWFRGSVRRKSFKIGRRFYFKISKYIQRIMAEYEEQQKAAQAVSKHVEDAVRAGATSNEALALPPPESGAISIEV